MDEGADDTELALELSLDPEYSGFDVGDCSLVDNPAVCLPEMGLVKSGSNEEKEDNPVSGGTSPEEPEVIYNNSGVTLRERVKAKPSWKPLSQWKRPALGWFLLGLLVSIKPTSLS